MVGDFMVFSFLSLAQRLGLYFIVSACFVEPRSTDQQILRTSDQFCVTYILDSFDFVYPVQANWM